MATVLLSLLRTYWQAVADWVTGVDTVSAPAVKLSGSNVQQDLIAVDTIITAGSTLPFAVATYSGKTLGIGVRLSVAAKFKITAQPYAIGTNISVGLADTVIDSSSTAALSNSQNYTLKQSRTGLSVINSDTADMTVRYLTATTFNT